MMTMTNKISFSTTKIPAHGKFPAFDAFEASSPSVDRKSGWCRTREEAISRLESYRANVDSELGVPAGQVSEHAMTLAYNRAIEDGSDAMADLLEAALRSEIGGVEWIVASQYVTAGLV